MEEHLVGGISKTGFEMFLIGCGSTLPFLTWVNKYRLMSFPLSNGYSFTELKLRQISTGAVQSICDHATSTSPPFGFIMRFKPMLGTLLKCVCVGCVCVSAEITPPAV